MPAGRGSRGVYGLRSPGGVRDSTRMERPSSSCARWDGGRSVSVLVASGGAPTRGVPRTAPFSAACALFASSAEPKVTKAMPLERPVCWS